jgi:type VI secretion system secreted protein Hcp
MDLILLQPGDPQALAGYVDPALADRLAGGGWGDSVVDPARCVALTSVQHGMKLALATDISTNARTVGRPSLGELACAKQVDQTSARLYDMCLRARALGEGPDKPTYVIVLRGEGGVAAPLIVYALRDALISEIELKTDAPEGPLERFKLSFTEILWSHTVPAATGKPNITAGWSVFRNRPILAFTRA